MDIDEINTHIHKLKCGATDWQSVEKLAALCTVRDELEEAHTPETQIQALPPATYAAAYSTAAEPQSDFVAAASSVPFGGLMQVLDASNAEDKRLVKRHRMCYFYIVFNVGVRGT